MKYFLLVSTLLLLGCIDNPMLEAKQDYLCRDKGGVYSYTYSLSNPMCQNGEIPKEFSWKEVKLPGEYYPKNRKEENE